MVLYVAGLLLFYFIFSFCSYFLVGFNRQGNCSTFDRVAEMREREETPPCIFRDRSFIFEMPLSDTVAFFSPLLNAMDACKAEMSGKTLEPTLDAKYTFLRDNVV